MRPALLLLALTVAPAQAQWSLQPSGTTASLRGIHAVSPEIAWASGTSGTVLHTADGGAHWLPCAIPPAAEHLDFRGIQAFDAQTAIVMSSGKGDLSRLYKTTDSCQTWTLVLTNPYSPDGFFDALLFIDSKHGIVFSDPSPGNMKTPVEYDGDFRIRVTPDAGKTWGPVSSPDSAHPGVGLHPLPSESAFAASNSSLAFFGDTFWFSTSAGRVASRRLYENKNQIDGLFQNQYCAGRIDPLSGECGQPWIDFQGAILPMNHASASAGIFSLAFRNSLTGNAVGGDYLKPAETTGNAAFTQNGGRTWLPATTPPHGYRSAVAYNPARKSWITVGPNGTDLSTDDGRNWHPLLPGPGEAPDSDKNWNALSLPFAVGPRGRIGRLNR